MRRLTWAVIRTWLMGSFWYPSLTNEHSSLMRAADKSVQSRGGNIYWARLIAPVRCHKSLLVADVSRCDIDNDKCSVDQEEFKCGYYIRGNLHLIVQHHPTYTTQHWYLPSAVNVFINLIKLIIIWASEVDLIFVTCARYNQMFLKWSIQMQLLTINAIVSQQHPCRHDAYFSHASLNMEHKSAHAERPVFSFRALNSGLRLPASLKTRNNEYFPHDQS